MSNFTRTVEKTFNFDGDEIKVTFNRLKTSDFRLMASHLEVDKDTGMPTGKVSFESQMDMIAKAIEILPARVESMTGLKDDQGNELSFVDIVNEQYFMGLVSEIFAAVMGASIVSDEKKSDVTSGGA